jgi:hypothetical protein
MGKYRQVLPGFSSSSLCGVFSLLSMLNDARSIEPPRVLLCFHKCGRLLCSAGKFQRILQPGLAILLPVVDRISYVHSLKEIALEIPSQSAITQGILLYCQQNM